MVIRYIKIVLGTNQTPSRINGQLITKSTVVTISKVF